MNSNKCTICFYKNKSGRSDIYNYYINLDKKVKAKIVTYILMLIANNYKLGMPYSRYIEGKIWELRVDFDKNFYRIFYFIFTQKKIVFLHGFNKKTNKTPNKEIKQAKNNYNDFLINKKL